MEKVVTRFAPSPTGFMHVGNVRTAIFAYLWAKRNGGDFILRIEDTDKAREVAGSIEHIMESLKWLGVYWDMGPDIGGTHTPYIQSQRTGIYNAYAQKLVDTGFAYVDTMSEEETEILRQKAEEEKRPFLYREHRKDDNIAWQPNSGLTLRFKIKEPKRYSWHDVVFGDLSAGEEALDDLVLIKADGLPTYNFAHIVDDMEMGVTHIMRGQEFISSTPKYLALYEALGAKVPIIASMPHIMAEGGQKKLGKRDGAKDILEYRNEGYLPEALFNFLAFLGFNPGGEKEVYTKDELINVFDINRIQKSGAGFNDDKLDWYNKEFLKLKSDGDFYTELKTFIDPKYLNEANGNITEKLIPIFRDHISKYSDVTHLFTAGEFDFFYEKPNYEKALVLNPKSKLDPAIQEQKVTEFLAGVKSILTNIDDTHWNKDYIKEMVMPYADEHGRGDVLWAMRAALTGKAKSPDPFTVAEILGKNKVLDRF
jgi:glutamyl-tRNA synthetase